MTLTGENKEEIAKDVVYLGYSKYEAIGDIYILKNNKI